MHKRPSRLELKSQKKKRDPNWDDIRKKMKYLTKNGAIVINQHGSPRTVQLPAYPGLKLLGACDCLVNYGGFTRVYSESEIRERANLAAGVNLYLG